MGLLGVLLGLRCIRLQDGHVASPAEGGAGRVSALGPRETQEAQIRDQRRAALLCPGVSVLLCPCVFGSSAGVSTPARFKRGSAPRQSVRQRAICAARRALAT